MPFYPMRPTEGRTLRSPRLVEQFYKEIKNVGVWIVQPKLNGDRATLAVVNNKVYIQNRHGGWYGHPVRNARAFLKLPDKTVLDGEVYQGNFCPFEALAVAGKSYLGCTASEREVMGFQMTQFVEQPWMFPKPTLNWLMRRSANQPQWGGVVIKRANSPYILLGSPNQISLTWFKRRWD